MSPDQSPVPASILNLYHAHLFGIQFFELSIRVVVDPHEACQYPRSNNGFLSESTPKIFESYITYFEVPLVHAVIVATVRVVAVFDIIHRI